MSSITRATVSNSVLFHEVAEMVSTGHREQHNENILTGPLGTEGFAPLFQSAALLQSDEIHRQQVVSTVLDIAERVPVYRLQNKPEREAVALSASLLTENNNIL